MTSLMLIVGVVGWATFILIVLAGLYAANKDRGIK